MDADRIGQEFGRGVTRIISQCIFMTAAALLLAACSDRPSEEAPPPAESAPAELAPDNGQEANDPGIPDGIQCLRLFIDRDDSVRVLDRYTSDGVWKDNRAVPMGRRLFFEVLDTSGTVVARGYRIDPRGFRADNKGEFLLTIPYGASIAELHLYKVVYEHGGTEDYSRSFRHIASISLLELPEPER